MLHALPFALLPSRVHEAQGSGRVIFAIWQAQRRPHAVWVRAKRQSEMPLFPGMTVIHAEGTDILWAAEEALRSMPRALVIAQPDQRLSLMAGRRLQLGAEAGGSTGLLLIRPEAGSPATETRWDCRPLAGDSTLHRWDLIKNKKGTTGSWTLDWDGTSAAFHMVSATGQRSGLAGQPG
ncbi:hypothetical protein RM190_17180 [Paracoccus sp. CPCC 101403]|uniref:Protein ImuA n=2 Tax=Paracoccus broussonetiae TaxID=3075834 RepID=A0ABU3EHA1_9RHOB|nr:hypothetical protein [Paracoccus sp. CPCC 101403]MDT1063608.1 hypothetical protein [Paracoccus sp. CPCC 101403]